MSTMVEVQSSLYLLKDTPTAGRLYHTGVQVHAPLPPTTNRKGLIALVRSR
jgi:hypothetical protein